jgi:hypothetical protein
MGNVKDQPKGIDGLKNRSGKYKGPGRGEGGTNSCLKRKVKKKKLKTWNNTPMHYAPAANATGTR